MNLIDNAKGKNKGPQPTDSTTVTTAANTTGNSGSGIA